MSRWRSERNEGDRRRGPKTIDHRLTEAERARIVETLTSPRFRDLPPGQVVARLADAGTYLASESSMYRILHAAGLLKHRGRTRPNEKKRVACAHRAEAPNRVWSWDITYLPSTVRGRFYFLYLALDIYSRKIVGWTVEETESADRAAMMLRVALGAEKADPKALVLHSDNGAPMRASTLLATLRGLGILPSFSRPHVSDDNPFSEALFRTLKYRPDYPHRPFDALDAARRWVERFVRWYNAEHLHSSLRFVTPADRHAGRDVAILNARRGVYEQARTTNPRRWSRSIRNWTPVGPVYLNPQRDLHRPFASAT